jgi:hypothetical protein
MPKVVRLKPYNPRKGYVLRRYVLGNQKFMANRWYHVGDAIAEKLSKVHSRPDHPEDSPLAFDLFDSQKEAEAQYVAEQEAEKEATVKNPEFVGSLTTADLESDAAKEARAERAKANLERATETKRRAEGKAGDEDEPAAASGGGDKSAADDDPAFQ